MCLIIVKAKKYFQYQQMYFCLTLSIVKRSTEKTVVVAAVPKTDLDNHVEENTQSYHTLVIAMWTKTIWIQLHWLVAASANGGKVLKTLFEQKTI